MRRAGSSPSPKSDSRSTSPDSSSRSSVVSIWAGFTSQAREAVSHHEDWEVRFVGETEAERLVAGADLDETRGVRP